MYGWKAYNEHNGFTAAQGALNMVETVGYLGYLWVVWDYGEGEKRAVGGGWGGVACLVGFALCVMTVSKTVLYCESHCLAMLLLWRFVGIEEANYGKRKIVREDFLVLIRRPMGRGRLSGRTF